MLHPLERDQSFVVVAVDGSPESASALRWAAKFADRSGQRLRVVTSYQVPAVSSDAAADYWQNDEIARAGARERVRSIMSEVLGQRTVEHIVSSRSIEPLLVHHGSEATMVVLGTRETRSWTARFRRSLTNRLTGKISCPVVSVPAAAASASQTPVAGGTELEHGTDAYAGAVG